MYHLLLALLGSPATDTSPVVSLECTVALPKTPDFKFQFVLYEREGRATYQQGTYVSQMSAQFTPDTVVVSSRYDITYRISRIDLSLTQVNYVDGVKSIYRGQCGVIKAKRAF